MILVTGATGNIGPGVVRALHGAGHRVRAAIHTTPLKIDGVETCPLDFDDPATFAPALRDIDALFLLSADVAHEAGLIDAAAAAGVRRIVYVSSFGAETDDFLVGRMHREIERRIAARGMTVKTRDRMIETNARSTANSYALSLCPRARPAGGRTAHLGTHGDRTSARSQARSCAGEMIDPGSLGVNDGQEAVAPRRGAAYAPPLASRRKTASAACRERVAAPASVGFPPSRSIMLQQPRVSGWTRRTSARSLSWVAGVDEEFRRPIPAHRCRQGAAT